MEELFSLTGLISLISLTDLWSLKALLSLITSLLKAEKIVVYSTLPKQEIYRLQKILRSPGPFIKPKPERKEHYV